MYNESVSAENKDRQNKMMYINLKELSELTTEELESALKQVKNRRAAGKGNILS